MTEPRSYYDLTPEEQDEFRMSGDDITLADLYESCRNDGDYGMLDMLVSNVMEDRYQAAHKEES